MKSNKAPGPRGIPNRVIKVLLKVVLGYFSTLFNIYSFLGYYPRAFRTAKIIILYKPKKNIYKIKLYRLIALLDTLGKVLEKIIASRLARLAETNRLLPDYQIGTRQGRNTIAALELVSEQI